MDRNKMTIKQEREFVNTWYDRYEKDFAKTFWTPYSDYNSRIGQGFEVVGRVLEDETDLECLPMWKIQFEDGEIIFAHPEEVINSEIVSVKKSMEIAV
jgi:hypothetical protein